jgi:beta-glucuronidase
VTANAPHDPFAHLHDEGYAAPYSRLRANADTLVAMGGRARMSLNGDWRFALDLYDEGLRQTWFADTPMPIEAWTVPRDYDLDPDTTITVPSSWTCVWPEWRYFEGGAWYTRFFTHEPGPGHERLVLHVGAAAYEARVFLNGRFVGSHRGASTPFCIELTDALVPGENRLQIQVDNRRRPERVPMHHFDWFNDGGLYREVDLVALPRVFIRHAGVALVPDGSFGRIALNVTLSDPVDGTATVTIAGLGLSVPVPVVAGTGRCVVDARPALWSPDNPRLHDVLTTFGDDRVTDRVGFREIRRDGHDILLNGRPIWLRGVCVHEDDVSVGKVATEEDLRRRFADARDLGCTVMRLAHYPHHERTAEIADETGMLLWAEIPVYWAIDFDNPDTYADAENQLLELIRRDHNRASVVLWGVGNENADTDARYRFMSGLAETARAADPTRLVAAACLINREAFRIEDRLAAHLDVIGLNEYFGWYEPGFEGLERLIANSSPDRPVVISETGADAVAGRRGPASELFTEDCQATVLAGQIAAIRDVPWIRGFFPWLLYDFRSPRRQTAVQRGMNRKGLIAEDKRTRKLAFETVARFYGERAAASKAG